MSIHKVFSTNLRERCLELGTFADACNRSAINRQQFNRYLSGATLPNSATLARICAYLKVREEELFVERDRSPEATEKSSSSIARIAALFRIGRPAAVAKPSGIGSAIQLSSFLHTVSVAEGYYFCYFPVQNLREFFVRTLIRISKSKDVTEFKRLTLFRSPGDGRKVIAFSKHFGIVLANRENNYFIAKNTNSDHGVSLLVTEKRTIDGTKLHRGIGVVQGFSSPMACRVSLELLPPMTTPRDIRRAISSLGVISSVSPELNPLHSALLAETNEANSNQLAMTAIESALHPSTQQTTLA